MKQTKYTDSFNEVFGNDLQNFVPFNISGINFIQFNSICLFSWNKNCEDVLNILGIGTKNGLTLYLDAHTQTSLYKSNKNNDRTFTLSLQHFDNFPLVALGGVVVKAGEKTRFNILKKVMK